MRNYHHYGLISRRLARTGRRPGVAGRWPQARVSAGPDMTVMSLTAGLLSGSPTLVTRLRSEGRYYTESYSLSPNSVKMHLVITR